MAQSTIPNPDLEQAFSKASLREKKLRQNATYALVVPAVAGALWLIYSVSKVTTWVSRSHEIQEREAVVAQREADAKQHVMEADAHRSDAEALVHTSQEKEAAARHHADDIQQRLVKVRREIGGLGTLLTEFSSARAKASKLMASEALETQLSEMRGTVGRTLGRIEQQIDTALPPGEQRPRVYIFLTDETQREAANALKGQLETSGFDVSAIEKNTTRRLEATEVRYYHESQDKADATRLLALAEKQLVQSGGKAIYTTDPDHAIGSRKFQIWLGKAPPAH